MDKRKPVGVDILMALGGGKHPPADDSTSSQDEQDTSNDGDQEGLPPDFEAAFKEYRDHPNAQSFWDAVEACVGQQKKLSDAHEKRVVDNNPRSWDDSNNRQALDVLRSGSRHTYD